MVFSMLYYFSLVSSKLETCSFTITDNYNVVSITDNYNVLINY